MWGEEQQIALEEIKCRIIKLPVLHLPDSKGRFHLYSDTSKFATGSALYQIQNRKTKLITCASKRLPEAARNYSITELEMCSLAINIVCFTHLLERVDFNAIVDHLVPTHIIKSKAEQATTIMKRLLELLSSYSFIYTIKKVTLWYLAISYLGKCLDPNIQPEKQVIKPVTVTKAKEVSQIKPRLGQGRAELRHKMKLRLVNLLHQLWKITIKNFSDQCI